MPIRMSDKQRERVTKCNRNYAAIINTNHDLLNEIKVLEPSMVLPREVDVEIDRIAQAYYDCYVARTVPKDAIFERYNDDVYQFIRNRAANLVIESLISGEVSIDGLYQVVRKRMSLEPGEQLALIIGYQRELEDSVHLVLAFFSEKVYLFLKSRRSLPRDKYNDIYIELQAQLCYMLDDFDINHEAYHSHDEDGLVGLPNGYVMCRFNLYLNDEYKSKQVSTFTYTRNIEEDMAKLRKHADQSQAMDYDEYIKKRNEEMTMDIHQLCKKYDVSTHSYYCFMASQNMASMDFPIDTEKSQNDYMTVGDTIADTGTSDLYDQIENVEVYRQFLRDVEAIGVQAKTAELILKSVLDYKTNVPGRTKLSERERLIIAKQIGIPQKTILAVLTQFGLAFAPGRA